jgi:Esterase-like activity of phytase
VDERDGKGRESNSDGSSNNDVVKHVFNIDLDGAVDVSNQDGLTTATHAVTKTLFLDLVTALTDNGIAANRIPAKIERIAFGPDVRVDHHTRIHTLWISNDNDSCCRLRMRRRYQIRISFLYSASRTKICLAMSRPRMGCRSGTR